MSRLEYLIDQLYERQDLKNEELLELLEGLSGELYKSESPDIEKLKQYARARCEEHYGNKVYMRGLIEFSNYCTKDCLYCGIRRSNQKVKRYRLTKEQILECCEKGYGLGYRTFVLQSGEDAYYNDEKIVEIIKTIKASYPECAITLSIGEKSKESYRKYKEAGVDRYLLRHEAADKRCYDKLHPGSMSLDERINCLYALKELGYQVGAGFMVGYSMQTNASLVKDLRLIKELGPQMVGIGPFIAQEDTPMGGEKSGTLEKTCLLLAIIRLLLPSVLLPATTALGSIHPKGRELGLMSGANVVMPNLSPTNVRDLYALYDGKICTGDEAAHCRGCIETRIETTGRKVDMSRGDHIDYKTKGEAKKCL